MKQYDFLIVGAGLFGAVFAHEAKLSGKRCLVIDKRSHSGGNIHCVSIEDINVHEYGAHIFHTNNEHVWKYVNQFVDFNHYINAPIAIYKNKVYNLPFNMNTFYQLWGVRTPTEAETEIAKQRAEYSHIKNPKNLEEQALSLCGQDIYERLIKDYTEKRWGCSATELPASIIKRIPFRFTFDNQYFVDLYQGIPRGGYNLLIDSLLEGIEVHLDTDFFDNRKKFKDLAQHIIYTGCIDEYFDFCCGKMDFRSLRFEHKHLDIANFQGNAIVNYTDSQVPYTRIIEHKHFESGKQPTTVITYEYPQECIAGTERFYPIENEKNAIIYKKYLALAAKEQDTSFSCVLTQNKCANMDKTIAAALELAESLLMR